MTTPPAYTGTDPYIFISYAHRDKNKVLPFIEELRKKYNVWYDDGLQSGRQWADEIAKKVCGCAVFLFMVSDDSLASNNCRGELNLAFEENKPFVNIIMEESISFPNWFRMRYMIFQDFRLYQFDSPKSAIEDFECRCPDLAEALSASNEPSGATDPEDPSNDDLSNDTVIIKKNAQGKFILFGVIDPSVETVIVPDGVAEVAERAFWGCTRLTCISFPKSLEHFDIHSFDGCSALETVFFNSVNFHTDDLLIPINKSFYCLFSRTSLKSVFFGSGVRRIPPYLFASCQQLTTVHFSDDVTEIGEFAFCNCKALSEIQFPERLISIGAHAFFGCGLRSVTLPRTLRYLGANAFYDCGALSTVFYHAEDCVADPNYNPEKESYECIFPGTLTHIHFGDTVRRIPPALCAFTESLCDVTFGKNLTEIGERAFTGCVKLKSVTIPETVKSIGKAAFLHCDALENLYFNAVDCSEPDLFVASNSTVKPLFDPNVKRLYVGDSVRRIPNKLFSFILGLEDAVIGNNVESIGDAAFLYCHNLARIVFPEGIRTIGVSAFSGCSRLKTVCFRGNKMAWKNVQIGENNPRLNGSIFTKAKFVFDFKD